MELVSHAYHSELLLSLHSQLLQAHVGSTGVNLPLRKGRGWGGGGQGVLQSDNEETLVYTTMSFKVQVTITDWSVVQSC